VLFLETTVSFISGMIRSIAAGGFLSFLLVQDWMWNKHVLRLR